MTEQEERGEPVLPSAVDGRMFTSFGVRPRTSSELLEDFRKTIDGLEREYLREARRILGGETPTIFTPSGSRALDMTF
ncbi:hypothetical protein [Streptomyces sp. NPDC057052]|uniref:hypothetical protein n=1 Tax=Streptomyces sp. NPDC057052 TaxID=3346010 RepID=UPI003630624C